MSKYCLSRDDRTMLQQFHLSSRMVQKLVEPGQGYQVYALHKPKVNVIGILSTYRPSTALDSTFVKGEHPASCMYTREPQIVSYQGINRFKPT